MQVESVPLGVANIDTYNSPAFYNEITKCVYVVGFSTITSQKSLFVIDGNPASVNYLTLLSQTYTNRIIKILCVDNVSGRTFVHWYDGVTTTVKVLDNTNTEIASVTMPPSGLGFTTASNNATVDTTTGFCYVLDYNNSNIFIIDDLYAVTTVSFAPYDTFSMNDILYYNGFLYVVCMLSGVPLIVKADTAGLAVQNIPYDIPSGASSNGKVEVTGLHFLSSNFNYFLSNNFTTGTSEYAFQSTLAGAILNFALNVDATTTQSATYIYVPYLDTNEVLLLEIVDSTYTYNGNVSTATVNGTCLTSAEREKIIYNLSQFCNQCLDCIGTGESFEVTNIIQGQNPGQGLGIIPIEA